MDDENSVQPQKGNSMADYIIEIPGHNNVTMNIGDTLRIEFKNSAKFCIDAGGNAAAFNPSLPVGVLEQAGWWPGPNVAQAATAIANATITYCHVGHDKQCGTCPKSIETPPGTIKVGSGVK